MTLHGSGAALCGNCGRPLRLCSSSGHAPVARRSSLWLPVHHSAHHPLQVRIPPVPGPPSSSPSPSSPTVLPRLPVWPSIRLLLAPRKLLEGRGPWKAWLRIGVCSGARLPRGRPECPPMCSCGTSTSPSAQWINAALRSSLRGSLFFTGLSWQSTPRSVLMVSDTVAVLMKTELC